MNELTEVVTAFNQGKLDEVETKVKKLINDTNRSLSERIQLMMMYIEALMFHQKTLTALKIFERMTLLFQVGPGLSESEFTLLVEKWTRFASLLIQPLEVSAHEIKPPFLLAPKTSYSNSSIIVHKNHLCLAIRNSNYTIKDDFSYECYNDVWNRYFSDTYLQLYDLQYRVVSYHQVVDKAEFPRFDTTFMGYEDPRLFSFNNKLYFTATNLQVYSQFKPHIVLCHLNDEGDISKVVPLSCPDMKEAQKNWLPFVDVHAKFPRLLTIYRMSPFIVLQHDIETGQHTEVVNIPTPHINFPLVKGSASPIPWGNGYLFVIHYTLPCRQPRNYMYYYHRFVWMDDKFVPTRMSQSFYVLHRGTEFISGLTYFNSYLYLTLSVLDERAYMVRFTAETLNHSLTWFDFSTGKTLTPDNHDLIPPAKLPAKALNDFTPPPMHLKSSAV